MVRRKAVVLFGTRPEVIKLAPVVAALERRSALDVVNVASSQHRDLFRPFAAAFGVGIDHDLDVMRKGQTPTEVCARVLTAFDRVIAAERPDMVLVQGDTTTALAGAVAGFHRGVPVGHVEADFIHLLSEAWLLVSDSGGVQEEAPTLGKPLLVLRENTERPEAIDCGVARLVGNDSHGLEMLLEQVHDDRSWFDHAAQVDNPFGRGDAGERIAASVEEFLGARS